MLFQLSSSARGTESWGVGCMGIEDFKLMLSAALSAGVGSNSLIPDSGVQLLDSVESQFSVVWPSDFAASVGLSRLLFLLNLDALSAETSLLFAISINDQQQLIADFSDKWYGSDTVSISERDLFTPSSLSKHKLLS